MEYAKKCNADLLLATDPDCDRVGIAVKNKAGEYELLTGNQTGILLLDYICSQRVKHGKILFCFLVALANVFGPFLTMFVVSSLLNCSKMVISTNLWCSVFIVRLLP